MGVFLSLAFRKRWLSLTGLTIGIVSAFAPVPTTARSVMLTVAFVLILAQIPVTIRADRRERKTKS
jgi:hypothetical protein